ncbi:GGDEF domain-containing protein [Allocatelliglobosispora scoriae]|uniref:GGDEF domain-containing protein n=1 Tax=Allocatelliglobosispora scoriae TaxID=643052 RepID=A0A841BPT9_9ACTN|nr:GGDEF domain-containing protein [Allocatelliglobosispora scoriae]MBB5868851.1 GGDEF domain-containing protein [Allocatelliglobosispora scoriae]
MDPTDTAATTWHTTHVDPRTGLLNRRAFHELAALRQGRSPCPHVAVVAALDDGEAISHEFGSEVGDLVLVAVARRFADYTTGHPAAHLDSGRFAAVVISSTTMDGTSYPDAQTMTRILAEPIWTSGRCVRARVSVGLADLEPTADLALVLDHPVGVLPRTPSLHESPVDRGAPATRSGPRAACCAAVVHSPHRRRP